MSAEIMSGHWLPVVFMVLMSLSLLLYVCLDGFDLGIGMLMAAASDEERDKMIATITPFWDANETWLVLGIGLLLVAFPKAHGIILSALYIPITLMLLGIILRGIAFDFRVKVHFKYRALWNTLFITGSFITSLSQGYMLGAYIMGFEQTTKALLFSCGISVCLAAAYVFIGACWLLVKSQGELFSKAIHWSKLSMRVCALGILMLSIVSPLVSERVFDRWFSFPGVFLLIPLPLMVGAAFVVIELLLQKMPHLSMRWHVAPFAAVVLIFILSFHGLAYSFFPFLVPERLDIWQAASSIEALQVIFYGVIFVLPTIIFYNIYAHRVFGGKIENISYSA